MNAPASIPVRVVFITPEETMLAIETVVEREHARHHIATLPEIGAAKQDHERAHRMTKTTRAAIIAIIDAKTDYAADTVKFHRDGSISAIKDPNKTFDGPEAARLLVGHVSDFARDGTRGE